MSDGVSRETLLSDVVGERDYEMKDYLKCLISEHPRLCKLAGAVYLNLIVAGSLCLNRASKKIERDSDRYVTKLILIYQRDWGLNNLLDRLKKAGDFARELYFLRTNHAIKKGV